ncbi:MAG: ATP-dependent zinc metalloprotease FtsH, partial [Oscillospiraceae bacterium]|nr:ATP-dependent zinc metalloprotease FtsH [Oscillospiraceae bacterium]
LVFDDITWGASADIQSATRTARTMVTRLGFSEKLGPVLYGGDSNEVFLGRDYGHTHQYSESTADLIDSEVKRIVNEAYKECERILTDHHDQLVKLAEYLLEHEKISGDDFEKMMKEIEEESSSPAVTLEEIGMDDIQGLSKLEEIEEFEKRNDE